MTDENHVDPIVPLPEDQRTLVPSPEVHPPVPQVHEVRIHPLAQPVKGFLDRYFFEKTGAWTAAFTFVLVVFSGLLAWVSYKANETSIISQRAFITFSGPVFIVDIADKKMKGTNVYYAMSNSGTTPANNVTLEWNLSLGQSVPDKNVDFDSLSQNERQKLVLGPKANYQVKPTYLTVEDWEKVSDGKEHLFLWGWVTYSDIFDGTPMRLSEFCTDVTKATWSSNKHTTPGVMINTVNPPCPTHNCYDRNCDDYLKRTQ